ncbi:A24 family peptidase [Novosphingobium album (ex Liu et al. 2023)]|uniref:Prepilin peptidase n=1 Tax=Novosphingobium album (ex Liu et al. 2023) TaxID=3031130 RepID=A0ABT5WRE1_9SPHN|nr:prepilin peptidase [Novosphingobium album (ex Liu et al. 2023)]MDE8652607.1 prepilin peptidase [Novosphingobium album (ex Liu et al. 2023)]
MATALLIAAFTDLKRRRIGNGLNLAIALGAPLFWFATGLGWAAIGFQILLAGVTFLVACGLFVARQMGGGDVKLLTALALWFVPESFAQLVVMMAVVGGGASIAAAACNMRRQPGESLRDGIAIVAAAAWVVLAAAVTFALGTGRPIVTPQGLAAIERLIPDAWMVWLLVAAALAIFLFGMAHIMRRQKSRLPIPYGVAITVAALWVMADQYLYAPPLMHGVG